jgi:hypothetical protein
VKANVRHPACRTFFLVDAGAPVPPAGRGSIGREGRPADGPIQLDLAPRVDLAYLKSNEHDARTKGG